MVEKTAGWITDLDASEVVSNWIGDALGDHVKRN
jgi:hypothetical protein